MVVASGLAIQGVGPAHPPRQGVGWWWRRRWRVSALQLRRWRRVRKRRLCQRSRPHLLRRNRRRWRWRQRRLYFATGPGGTAGVNPTFGFLNGGAGGTVTVNCDATGGAGGAATAVEDISTGTPSRCRWRRRRWWVRGSKPPERELRVVVGADLALPAPRLQRRIPRSAVRDIRRALVVQPVDWPAPSGETGHRTGVGGANQDGPGSGGGGGGCSTIACVSGGGGGAGLCADFDEGVNCDNYPSGGGGGGLSFANGSSNNVTAGGVLTVPGNAGDGLRRCR